MVYQNELETKFYINPKEYDVQIHLEINGSDKFLKQLVLDSLFFDLPKETWIIQALVPQDNVRTLSRLIYLKRKQTTEKKNE